MTPIMRHVLFFSEIRELRRFAGRQSLAILVVLLSSALPVTLAKEPPRLDSSGSPGLAS